MSTRMFNQNWSPALKQQIAEMSDQEYAEWIKSVSESVSGLESPTEKQALVFNELDIEEWSKNKPITQK